MPTETSPRVLGTSCSFCPSLGRLQTGVHRNHSRARTMGILRLLGGRLMVLFSLRRAQVGRFCFGRRVHRISSNGMILATLSTFRGILRSTCYVLPLPTANCISTRISLVQSTSLFSKNDLNHSPSDLVRWERRLGMQGSRFLAGPKSMMRIDL